jgi:PiT family inorganic phosphate transporter
LGTNLPPDGTTGIQVGSGTVKVVAYCGHVKMVTETVATERAGLLYKVVIPMVTSPLLGFVGGLIVMALLYTLLRRWRPTTVGRVFGRLQLLSSAYMGFSHGMNDATKCMGIITLALVAATKAGLFHGLPPVLSFLRTPEGSDPHRLSLGDSIIRCLPEWLRFGYMPAPIDPATQAIPNWVVVLCALTMAAGTAAGGWRIIRTLGHRMVKLQPVHGFAAETTAATVLAITAHLGMPVSTTHAISTSIMGVGCAKRFSALKLQVIERIVWAWIMTIPATMGVAYCLVSAFQWIGWIK